MIVRDHKTRCGEKDVIISDIIEIHEIRWCFFEIFTCRSQEDTMLLEKSECVANIHPRTTHTLGEPFDIKWDTKLVNQLRFEVVSELSRIIHDLIKDNRTRNKKSHQCVEKNKEPWSPESIYFFSVFHLIPLLYFSVLVFSPLTLNLSPLPFPTSFRVFQRRIQVFTIFLSRRVRAYFNFLIPFTLSLAPHTPNPFPMSFRVFQRRI